MTRLYSGFDRTLRHAALVVAAATRTAAAQEEALGGPDWTLTGDGGTRFGQSVSGSGDVNGDGFDDLVVGRNGRAYLYFGSSAGPSATPDVTLIAGQSAGGFGFSVCICGDVDGDGFDDVMIGAPEADHPQNAEGRVFVYLGSAAGPSSTPAWTAESNQPGAYFGRSVSGAGDVNGDGFDDVLVGAPLFDGGEPNEGRAYLFLGSASGLSVAPDWTAEGNQVSANFGSAVRAAGDVNGDGFDDVLVGAPLFDGGEANEGRIFLYLGTPSGLSAAATWTAESDHAEAKFGASVSAAGDVDGDGFDDVVIGADMFSRDQVNEGRVLVYAGSAARVPIPMATASPTSAHRSA